MRLGLIPIMRVLYSLWGQTMNFILLCFVWLAGLAVIGGAAVCGLYEVFGAPSAYPNTWRGRLGLAIREFFLF